MRMWGSLFIKTDSMSGDLSPGLLSRNFEGKRAWKLKNSSAPKYLLLGTVPSIDQRMLTSST
jgi:hypothetical protein